MPTTWILKFFYFITCEITSKVRKQHVIVKLAFQTVMCMVSSLFKNKVVLTVKIL